MEKLRCFSTFNDGEFHHGTRSWVETEVSHKAIKKSRKGKFSFLIGELIDVKPLLIFPTKADSSLHHFTS
jgi:hypothetical protein